MSLSKPIQTPIPIPILTAALSSPIKAPLPHQKEKLYWRLLLPKHGDLYLHNLKITCLTNPSLLQHLQQEIAASHSFWKKLIPFLVPVVYIAIISDTSSEDIEAQSLPCIVDIDAKSRCHILTNALRHPLHPLPARTDLVASYRRFAVVREGGGGVRRKREALLVGDEISLLGLVTVLVWTVLVAVVPGVGVGVWFRDLGLGLGVTGGVAGVLGLVEGFLFWIVR